MREKIIQIKRIRGKKGQVWVETVLYTLIGLALIGLVLAFVMPKINAAKDKISVEQAITSMNALDVKINEVLKSEGNVRNLAFTIKRGALSVYSSEKKIVYEISGLAQPYSQPGIEISDGNVKILTSQGQKTSSVNMTLQYGGFILSNGDGSAVKKYNPSSVPYQLRIKSEKLADGITLNVIISESTEA